MRLAYSHCAHIFLFLVQWTDCHFAGALGLLRIHIYKVNFPIFLVAFLSFSFLGMKVAIWCLLQAYEDGNTSMYIHERKASIKQFYGALTWMFLFSLLKSRCRAFQFLLFLISMVFIELCCHWTGVIFPSLLQLQRGITDIDDRKQRELCATKYRRGDETSKGKLSEIEIEREEECGICMEMNTKVVLPSCNHSLCLKCYRNWWANSSNLLDFPPFCYFVHTKYSLVIVQEGCGFSVSVNCQIIASDWVCGLNLLLLWYTCL